MLVYILTMRKSAGESITTSREVLQQQAKYRAQVYELLRETSPILTLLFQRSNTHSFYPQSASPQGPRLLAKMQVTAHSHITTHFSSLLTIDSSELVPPTHCVLVTPDIPSHAPRPPRLTLRLSSLDSVGVIP